MTKVYIVDITNYCDNINIKINENRLQEAKKFKQSKSYYHSVYAWLLLKYVIKINYNIDIDTLKLLKNEDNKTFFNGDIHFNISHSHNYICVGISDNEIGVDVEQVNAKISTLKLTRKVLTEDEKQEYIDSIDKDDYFFFKWTKKEAYLKMIGVGLKKDMTKINVDRVYTTEVYDIDNQKYYLSVIPNDEVIIKKINIESIIKL